MDYFLRASISQFMKILLIVLITYAIPTSKLLSQNYGLKKPQDPSTLPKSRAEIIKPELKPKINEETMFIPGENGCLVMSSGWELIEASEQDKTAEEISSTGLETSAWYNAIVPGTVLTTLVERGVYPDPYFGINNLSIPDTLCRQNWWYRNEFRIPEGNQKKNVWLNFNGINYKADIWLNGVKIGSIKGAFIRGEFDISNHIKLDCDNVLAVHIYPPPNPGIPHEESPSAGTGPNGGQLCKDGPTFIASEGWDWIPGIRDRNIGIWQDVTIKFTDAVTLVDPQIITDLNLPDTTEAYLTINSGIKNSRGESQNVIIRGRIDDKVFDKEVLIPPYATRSVEFSHEEFNQLIIDDPALWWPNGYGKPNLYDLDLVLLTENDIISDSVTVRFGIRELTYDLNVDTKKSENIRINYNPVKLLSNSKPVINNLIKREVMPGTVIPKLRDDVDLSMIDEGGTNDSSPFLVVKVNGQPVYCKGGNWGMDDGMKRVSRERLEPYIRLQRDANFTMIRNWTGESTEKVFYELCDEYGLLVWNDFWLSTEGWNLEVDDNELFLKNAEDVIKRFRNHPSIAIWCARNEGYPVPELEEGLSNLVAEFDGTRLYHPNSRYLNLRPSGPWHYLENPAEYFTTRAEGFSTELGTPSVPTAETMRSMMAEEDVWPIGDVWYYHDLHDGQIPYRKAIDKLFGGPQVSVEEFCRKAQMINYESHRAMFESWNRKMWNAASGLLIWMSHPAWPSTVWQIYSSDYETPAAYFAAKKACEPVHVQLNLHNDMITVVNTTLKSFDKLRLTWELIGTDAGIILSDQTEIELGANSRRNCFKLDTHDSLPEVYFIRLKITDPDDVLLSENVYWRYNGEGERNFNLLNDLPNVSLQASNEFNLTVNNLNMKLDITNPSASIALMVKLNLRDSETGSRILPAFFSDGYFTLLPGESRLVTVESKLRNSINSVSVTAEGYNSTRHTVTEINFDKTGTGK